MNRTLGGGFDINHVFGGEMYNLNVFKKNLSLEDVAAMFYSGRCARLAKFIGYDVILSWKDILAAKRSGDVRVVDAGCGSPNMMELRARLNDIINATDAIVDAGCGSPNMMELNDITNATEAIEELLKTN